MGNPTLCLHALMSKHFLMVTSAVLGWSKVTEHKSDGKCTLGNSWKYIVNNVYCTCIMSIYFIKTCRFQLWDKYVNSLTQLKDVGQLWFWSSRAVVWVQTDQCEGGFAAVRLLHLIPGLHYTTGPVKQHTDMGTSPSLQRRRGILYCLMHHWGNIITSTKCCKV